MPQQPKITGDAEVDSWALQVTQELNDTQAEADTPIMVDMPPAFSSNLTLSVLLDGETYFWTAQESIDPPFLARFGGLPEDSHVYIPQADFTVTVTALTGILQTSATPTITLGTAPFTTTPVVTPNSFAYTGSDFNGAGTYNFSSAVTGTATDGTAANPTTITDSFTRFVPAFWSVGLENTPPTALPLTNPLRELANFTATGNTGQAIYYMTSNTTPFNFRDSNGFEIFEERRSTITATDTAGVERTYVVYEMGIIGTSGIAQLVCA